MSGKEAQRLKKLKAIDLAPWATSFWVVHRKPAQPPFVYTVLRVTIDKKLERRLKRYVKVQVQDREFKLEPYDFSNADPGESLLTLDADTTDFSKVRAAIDQGFDNPRAKSHAELLGSFAYVVLFEKDGEHLHAWSKINTLNSPRKAVRAKTLYFQDQKLVDVDDEEVFMIDPRFDFFVFAGTTFIASKSAFESSMNFREGMPTKRKELLDEFSAMSFLSDVEPIRAFVGENLHHLRKLAAIKNAAGDYNNDGTADIAFRNSVTGELLLWKMANAQKVNGYLLGQVDLSWNLASAQDVNANGTDDIVWRNSQSGEIIHWDVNNFAKVNGYFDAIVDTSWTNVGNGDFGADGVGDLIWRKGDLVWFGAFDQWSSPDLNAADFSVI